MKLNDMKWIELNWNYTLIKRLLCQLGFISQGRRPSIELLKKSRGLIREIKNLDKQGSRQTFKVAVVYIGQGQEEKQEILSNSQGSVEFERFASGLGWTVNLANHQGFTGGLQYPEDGDTATYFSSPAVEVIFHVSTQMASATDEDRHRMFRHLGNDEVMIIWTEHWRSFRRSSLRTEFGDVLIIISPLKNGLFRIEIRKEPEIPFFGPLIDGMLVSEENLPFLVRSTAIHANAAINSRKPNFKEHFEERFSYLQSIITSHIQNTAFEDFIIQMAMPKPLMNVSPQIRISRCARNHSESLSGAEDPVLTPLTTTIQHQSPLIPATRGDRLNAPSIPSIAQTLSDVPQHAASTKEQSRMGIFSRISLRHKRRSIGVQGHRGPSGRTFNTTDH